MFKTLGVITGLLAMTLPAAAAEKRVEWIAHRGESYLAPENTMAAVNLGWELGADAVEFDVHLSSDGKLVVIHDADTFRVTGGEGKGQKLIVKETDAAALQKLDVGSWKDPKYAGEKMPLIGDVLATVPQGKRLYLEIKTTAEAVPAAVEAIKSSGKKPEQIVIISFKEDTCAEIKKALPQHKVFFLSSIKQDKQTTQWGPTAQELIATAKRLGVDGLDIQAKPPVDAAFIKKVKDAGLEFYAWTVDDPELASQLIHDGADGITTNRPAWLREQVAGN